MTFSTYNISARTGYLDILEHLAPDDDHEKSVTPSDPESHFAVVQDECLKKTGELLPLECLEMIFGYVDKMMAEEKMKYEKGIFKQIHHALQPCSVCGKLLAIDVDDQGEIKSSGKPFNRHARLPTHTHASPDGIAHTHWRCYPEYLDRLYRRYTPAQMIDFYERRSMSN